MARHARCTRCVGYGCVFHVPETGLNAANAASSAADILPDASACGPAAGDATAGCASKALGLFASHVDERRVWDAADNARVFLKCVVMYHEQRSAELGSAVFDKDDDLAVDFVTAASNLRAMCYGIPTQTAFHAKGMAGNIIHAIATTNAIIAGFIVTEATKVRAGVTISFRGTVDACSFSLFRCAGIVPACCSNPGACLAHAMCGTHCDCI